MRLTRIFPSHIRPVNVGVYLVENEGVWLYSYWNGLHWCHMCETAEIAETYNFKRSMLQDKNWRGITEHD